MNSSYKFILQGCRKGIFKTASPCYSFRSTQSLSAPRKDFYKMLNVDKDATQEEIKKAYYKLVQKYHPDKNPHDQEGSKAKLSEINSAYDTLKDETKRKTYDMTGMTGDEQAQAGGGNPFAGGGRSWGGQGGPSAEDIFGDFESFFNMGNMGGERVSKGADVVMSVDISFMEAVSGVVKKVSFEKKGVCTTCSGSKCKPGTAPSRCTACGGRGSVNYRQGPMQIQMQCTKCGGSGQTIKYPCGTCRGSGVGRVKIEEDVQIPKGINSGQNLRMPKKGSNSENGGAPGDLIVKVNVKPDTIFAREGYDIITTQFITLSEAVLGTRIKVKTLTGEKEIDVKPCTSHGDKMKLKGLGISHLPPNQGTIGDQIIQFKIFVPKTLTPAQKELYQRLQEVEEKILPDMNLNRHNSSSSSSSSSNNNTSGRGTHSSSHGSSGFSESDENVFSKFKNMWGK